MHGVHFGGVLAGRRVSRLRLMIPAYARGDEGHKKDTELLSPACLQTVQDLISLGVVSPHDATIYRNTGLLVYARAQLLSWAMHEPEVDELLFLDADMGVGAGTIQAMREACEDAIGLAYQMRYPPHSWVVSPDEPYRLTERAGHRLMPCRGLALGCVLLQRWCIEDAILHWPELECVAPQGWPMWNLFAPLIADHRGRRTLLTEDYSFCRRLGDAGVTMDCFVDAIVDHAGDRSCFGALIPDGANLSATLCQIANRSY